jgi:hypothetical protein
MANEVKVSFVGDTSDLSKKLDKLESDVKKTSKEIDKATGSTREMSKGLGRLRDTADESEGKFQGLAAGMTGSADVMKGLREGDMLALATGLADLSDSVAKIGAQMLDWGKKALEAGKQVVEAHLASVAAKAKDVASMVAHKVATAASTIATGAMTAAQWALNAAMTANPIGLVIVAIVALVAAFVIAWKNSETFREIVTGAFEAVKNVAETVFNWVKDNWKLLLGILTGPFGLAILVIVEHFDKIRDTFADVFGFFVHIGERLFNAIKRPFVEAFEWVKTVYDNTIAPILDKLNKFNPFGGGGGLSEKSQLAGARALGGPVSAGRSYLVGERGPEVFTPGRSGAISANGGGSQTIVLQMDSRTLFTWLVDASRDAGGIPLTLRNPT